MGLGVDDAKISARLPGVWVGEGELSVGVGVGAAVVEGLAEGLGVGDFLKKLVILDTMELGVGVGVAVGAGVVTVSGVVEGLVEPELVLHDMSFKVIGLLDNVP